VLAKQAEEKEDPASRQRALKEVFDEKAQKQKRGKKRKTVVWAEELAQFQTEEGKAVELGREREKEKAAPTEEKKNAVKVGVRSKMTLGMAVNGTPAPKRKMRGRS
jgi:6-phosphofructokinase